jgi:maltose alpha-D-glucosyltransferase/alpha-amylase
MLFNLLMNNYFFLALAREEAEPLVKVLGLLPDRPFGGQWANWIRNHDELDLERLSRRERDDVMRAFAPDDDMRIYGRGIRRRFAPMVGGDRRRLELAHSLLFALPGAPVVRYGEEIGMGDDLTRVEREAVRTPMQWAPTTNGGFSTAAPDDLLAPLVRDEGFGVAAVNVADQERNRDSLLARMHTFISVRRQHPEIGDVEPEVVETGDEAVFALSYTTDRGATVVVHNLAADDRTVELRRLVGRPFRFDVLADREYDPVDGDVWKLALAGYGYRWLSAGPPPTASG